MSPYSINLVAALPAEARPIASRFGLERAQPDFGFPLYRRGHVALVVTGTGKIDAAAATGCLGAMGGCRREAIWVNLGIAGHAERCVGEVLLADSITDAGSGRIWCPTLPQDRPCLTECLLTLDRPDTCYEGEGMLDMEASGFFPTACRYSSVELVQVLKVISDNRETAARGLSAKQVHRLMEGTLEILEALIERLRIPARVG